MKAFLGKYAECINWQVANATVTYRLRFGVSIALKTANGIPFYIYIKNFLLWKFYLFHVCGCFACSYVWAACGYSAQGI